MKIKKFIKNHLDFCYSKTITPAVLCLLGILPCVLYLPETYGFENGFIENIQMFILFLIFIMCIKAKHHKQFFIFMAMVVLLLSLREINYGRTIFFPIPGQDNMFYSWSEIKYGYLVHPIVALYILSITAFFFIKKVHLTMWTLLTKVKLPVFDFIMIIIGIILGVFAEKCTHSFVFEEMAELLFYLSFASIVYLYGYNKVKPV